MTPAPFLNRELSWLEFNQRVLGEANDPSNPLLERVKFLSITGSNLDEFFRVRVGSLQAMVAQGRRKKDPSGMTPRQQLATIRQRVRQLVTDQYACYEQDIEPQLAEAGIQRIVPGRLSRAQLAYLERLFQDEIYPLITPARIDDPATAPLLADGRLYVMVRLRIEENDTHEQAFAILPLGMPLNRLITLPSEKAYAFIFLEDIVMTFIDRFFPGIDILETAVIRMTRNADLGVREDLASDLLAEMEQVLKNRRVSNCIRLEITSGATHALRHTCQRMLAVEDDDTVEIAGPLDLKALMPIALINGFDDLKSEPWPPQPSPELDPTISMFDSLRTQDILLYHPQQSFEPVLRLINEAADDPQVLAIKQTLYRTSSGSPIIEALARAAEKGKSVTVIVELKARFDEARNIDWARKLEQAGAQVIYGIKGFKTHAKLCIIIRREPQGIVRYLHMGTGNYNEITACLYTDISLMTCDPDLGSDATRFFNTITGFSQPQRYLKIAAAPLGLRDALVSAIRDETQRQLHGQKAQIMAKMNSLVDPDVIEALYEASRAGVRIDLNVRGICCLCPGVPGFSETITVTSIVDRFLEHDRIFYFHHGGERRVFISSADWMPRNLDRRIELLIPVEETRCRNTLIALLKARFKDTAKAHRLGPDGHYSRVRSTSRSGPFRSQQEIYLRSVKAVKDATLARAAAPFVPHQAPGH